MSDMQGIHSQIRHGLAATFLRFEVSFSNVSFNMFTFRASINSRRQNEKKIMRVIGIDPGLVNTGWGVIERGEGSRLRYVASGALKTKSGDMAPRLSVLFRALSEVIAEYAPDVAAVENTFVNRDPAGALKLGHARAIALLTPAEAGLQVFEYYPNAVKKTVVGVGHADKAQVEHMVKLLLPGATPETPDAADALAIAICHAQHAGAKMRIKVSG